MFEVVARATGCGVQRPVVDRRSFAALEDAADYAQAVEMLGACAEVFEDIAGDSVKLEADEVYRRLAA